MPKLRIGLQLYTLRDLTARNFPETIARIARMGYEAVELAGYGNLTSAAQVKRVLDDHGVVVAGSHVGIDVLENDLSRALDESQTLGNPNIIVPWWPQERRRHAADWRAAAGTLTRIGQTCQTRGFQLSYHNHSFEFETFDGQTGFDLLFDDTSPRLLTSELDVYWARHGGYDPVEMINKLGPRIRLLHLKDMAPGDEKRFGPVGTGLLDFPAILAAAETSGITWGIVEQDNTYDAPPLEAVQTSLDNLKALRLI